MREIALRRACVSSARPTSMTRWAHSGGERCAVNVNVHAVERLQVEAVAARLLAALEVKDGHRQAARRVIALVNPARAPGVHADVVRVQATLLTRRAKGPVLLDKPLAKGIFICRERRLRVFELVEYARDRTGRVHGSVSLQ